ncbi:hypothetical protein LSH36_610g00016 [Paralvinella palmiformis]|uniref:Uncharacterized protein n=1 Tax=Paralvinella palmiformis TaxID=53620 RepID=A0AAD9J4C7_9ANNE|nr:hypothetical protein LSH36_610g00016 [Paralvinella palmiformis]
MTSLGCYFGSSAQCPSYCRRHSPSDYVTSDPNSDVITTSNSYGMDVMAGPTTREAMTARVTTTTATTITSHADPGAMATVTGTTSAITTATTTTTATITATITLTTATTNTGTTTLINPSLVSDNNKNDKTDRQMGEDIDSK